jgi:hypothetical protein
MGFLIALFIIVFPGLAFFGVEIFYPGNGILGAVIVFIIGVLGSIILIARADRGTSYGGSSSSSDDGGFFSFMSFGDSDGGSSSWGGDCSGGDSGGGSCD